MSRPGWRPHSGFSLIVVLLILVVATVLGVGAAQVALIGERSARNDRDTETAFQAAEAALADAESDLLGPNDSARQRLCLFAPDDVTAFAAGCGGPGKYQGLCGPGDPGADPAWMTADFSAGGGRSVAYGTFTGKTYPGSDAATARVPRYIVEAVRSRRTGHADALQDASAQSVTYIFRVTAIGFGMREETQVVLQTNVYKPAATPGCLS